MHNGKPPSEKIVMPFSMLLNLVGSSNADNKEILWKFINKFHKEINAKEHIILDKLTEYAINYFKDKVQPNKKYKKRVLQLGEKENNIFLVGTPAIDNIFKLKLLSKSEIQKELDFKLGKKNLLITFHPVTLEKNTSEIQMKALLEALGKLKDTQLVSIN